MSRTRDACHVVALPTVLTREVDGELVLLDLASENYLGFDGTGLDMWKALVSSPTVEAALQALLEIYEVEPERLGADLDVFLDDVEARGLVEVRAGTR